MRRREFMGGALAAGVGVAQDRKGSKKEDAPARKAKVKKLFKSPDGHPNAMEAAAEGMWVRSGDRARPSAGLEDGQGPASVRDGIAQHEWDGGWRRISVVSGQRRSQ